MANTAKLSLMIQKCESRLCQSRVFLLIRGDIDSVYATSFFSNFCDFNTFDVKMGPLNLNIASQCVEFIFFESEALTIIFNLVSLINPSDIRYDPREWHLGLTEVKDLRKRKRSLPFHLN